MFKRLIYIPRLNVLKTIIIGLFALAMALEIGWATELPPVESPRPEMKKLKEYLRGLHPWESSTRGFRQDHNVTFGIGQVNGDWTLSSNGQDFGTFSDSHLVATFGYEFHLRLVGGLGYLLGSSIGIGSKPTTEEFDSTQIDNVNIDLRLLLPGVKTGFVLNINPLWRASFVFDLYLERLEGFSSNLESFGRHSATGRVWGWGVRLDWFYRINWGIRTDYHVRNAWYDKTHVSYNRWDQLVRIGMVYHLI